MMYTCIFHDVPSMIGYRTIFAKLRTSISCRNTLQLIYLYLLHLLSTRKLQNPHLMLVRPKCTKYYNQLITPMLLCTQPTKWT